MVVVRWRRAVWLEKEGLELSEREVQIVEDCRVASGLERAVFFRRVFPLNNNAHNIPYVRPSNLQKSR